MFCRIVERTAMRKFALILSVFIGSASIALADSTMLLTSVPINAKKAFMGVIKFVSWADPSKGTKSEIVVKNAVGQTIHILVKSTTTLWDSDNKAIMQDKIIEKKRVNVIYITTPEGINEAKSVKILK